MIVCRAVDRAVSVGREERYFRRESIGDKAWDTEDRSRSIEIIRRYRVLGGI